MDGRIYSNGRHLANIRDNQIYDLTGKKLYDLKGQKIYKPTGELVGHLSAGSGERPLDKSTDREAVTSEPVREETTAARDDNPPPLASQAATTVQTSSPLASQDLDTAIHLRWALRDIKANRTKLTPISPSDLNTLIELGLVEIREDAPMLTNEGHRALDR